MTKTMVSYSVGVGQRGRKQPQNRIVRSESTPAASNIRIGSSIPVPVAGRPITNLQYHHLLGNRNLQPVRD